MKIQYLRSSSINTYSGCQFQYFMEYVLGLPSLSGKKALLGTIVHHVLEIMARAKKNNHLSGVFVNEEKLLEICWNRYLEEETGRFKLEKRDFNFCKKTIAKVLDGPYNPLKLNVIDTEKRFQLPLDGDGFSYEFYDLLKKETTSGQYELRGTSDLITKIDSETLEIIDWKTGSRKCWNTGVMKDYDYLKQDDIQLRVYDLAMSIVYPQYKTRLLTVHFINDGGPFTVTFDDNERRETLSILKNRINSIKENWLPTRLKETKPKDARWKCKNVCHFGKTKGPNGNCICDNVYYYMLEKGMDKTELRVSDIKEEKKNSSLNKTSDRRNIY